MTKKKLLDVNNLSISFQSDGIDKEIIHHISYTLNKNEILGIVGESGSGKSVSTLAILGLLPKQISKITSGSILFNEKDLTQLNTKDFQNIRGSEISMIFQEPMSSLNPSMKCGQQVEEILLQHRPQYIFNLAAETHVDNSISASTAETATGLGAIGKVR